MIREARWHREGAEWRGEEGGRAREEGWMARGERFDGTKRRESVRERKR